MDNDPVIRMCAGIRNPLGAITNGKGVVVFMTWIPHEGFPTFYWCDPRKTKPDTYNFVHQLGYHEPKGALVQSNGRFWVHGYAYFAEWTNGGAKLNLVPNEFRNEQSLKFDYAYYSFEDRENNIWICTDNGLYLFNPDEQVFNTYYLARPNGKSSNEGVVQAVEETKDHKVLIGCWGTGMYAFDTNMNPVELPGALRKKGLYYSVWDMSTNYKTGDIWIAQQGGLLAVYDQAKDRLVEVNHEIFGGSTIRQVDEDTSGNMWFGTQSGRIIKWDIKKAGNDPRKGFELITMTGMVHKIHYDYQGFVYVATFGKGLLKINAKTNKVVYQFTTSGPEGKRLFMNYPSDMTYYNDTTLLVAASCLNIINTKTNKVSPLRRIIELLAINPRI
jgi:ligand-binding sensor domain-containing protein